MEIIDPVSGDVYVRKLLRRYDEVGHARELTFSCYHRYRFLDRDRTRKWFLESLDRARREQPFDLWAYVIMPEHVHLLIFPREDGSREHASSEVMAEGVMDSAPPLLLDGLEADSVEMSVSVTPFLRMLKEPVARKAISYLKKHAPEWLPRIRVKEGKRIRHRFWQPGGGYDRNIVDPDTLRSVINYFHGNPVRRGLVEKPEDWEWSSARWYAGLRPVLLEMDTSILEILGGTP